MAENRRVLNFLMSSARRYPTLDLLRLIAIGLTMLVHTPSLVLRVWFLRPFAHGMWLGVDLFMLISGWLLGGQLLREAANGTLQPWRFYVKRWLRTLPPYYAMLAILYFGHGPEFSGPLPSRVVLEHLTFLQVYAGHNEYLVSWSLCVEEHFYLLLPLIVVVLLRWPRLWVVVTLVLGVEVASLICRVNTYTDQVDHPYMSHLRCDGLFIGLLLAWINVNRPARWQRLGGIATWAGIVGVISTLLVMAWIPPAPSRWMYIVAPALGTWTLALLFFACVSDGSRASRLGFPGLQYLGELTYAMYLVHHVVPRSLLGTVHAGEAGLRGVLLRLGLVMVLSMLLHHLVERPALRLRERLLMRWKSPAPAAPSAA
jgi:peptidoglycan/LPS O-acetylase OafA/YrhL